MWDRGRIAAFLFFLSCSPEGREVSVRFGGQPSWGALFEDTRAVVEACPSCGAPLDAAARRCACGEDVRRTASVPCGFCGPDRACAVCTLFETSGACRHCRGDGCFNCAGSGACAACGGSARCDACGGGGSLSLPWKRAVPPMQKPSKESSTLPAPPKRPVVWQGEEVEWTGGGATALWTIYRVEGNSRVQVRQVRGDPARFRPPKPGLYMAAGRSGTACFDVLGFTPRSPGIVCVNERFAPKADFEPPLDPRAVRWEVRPQAPRDHPGGYLLDKPVRYEFRPRVEGHGLPPAVAVHPLTVDAVDLRVLSPSEGPFRSGAAIAFRAEGRPPLPEGVGVEWTSSGPASIRVDPSGLVFPQAGVYAIRARAGGCVSDPVEVRVFAVSLTPEARLTALPESAFDDRHRLRGDAVAVAPERAHLRVEDPGPNPGTSVTVRTRAQDGSELNRPVSYSLGTERTTRAMLFVADRSDEAAEAEGRADDAPEDPTLLAAPRGTVEVFYRGTLAAVFPVAPSFLHEIPVRFIVLRRPGLPNSEDLNSTLLRRLEEANAVWSPLGRRFRRTSTELVDPPRHLLLVRGKAAGLNEAGRPGRVGARVDGADWSVSTAWAMMPAATAKALAQSLPPGHTVDLLEGMLASDPDAVVLRVRRRDSTPAKIEPLAASQDVSQYGTPLTFTPGAACELAPGGISLTLDEAAILAGCRGQPGETLDLMVIGEMVCSADRRAFRVYPPGAGIVGGWILEARYPYALARVLGELLLPPGVRPREEDTLFREPLSEAVGLTGHKRVGAETARRILERGRGLAGKK